MQCPICNKVASEDARFCDQCGHDLQSQQSMIEAEPVIEELSPALVAAQVESESVEEFVDSSVDHDTLMSDQLDLLPEESEPVTAPEPATTGELPISGPRLILQDDEAIYTLSVGQDIIIGREDPLDGIYPDIDLTPHDVDTGVSRQHASLHEQGGQWFIKDLASTNYTIVNRRRLTAHEDFLLEDGDELRFGRVVAEFKM